MKFSKLKPKNLGIALIFTAIASEPLQAEIGLGDVWGTAWTIGNIITGETTLTPAYAIDSYVLHLKEVNLNNGTAQSTTMKAKRDLLGRYFYHTKTQSATTVLSEHTDAFPVSSINKVNITCEVDIVGDDAPDYRDTWLESHTALVWMAKVEATGLWPDNGPWEVWLKTSGQKN